MEKIIYRKTLGSREVRTASQLLAEETGLSRSRVKRLINQGAVWLTRGSNRRRLRRATAALHAGDRIEMYYDPAVAAARVLEPFLLCDAGWFSLWYKPAGMLCQGTSFGDHGSLLRQAGLFFPRPRKKGSSFIVSTGKRRASACLPTARKGRRPFPGNFESVAWSSVTGPRCPGT
jgi:tRNA pseudouridine32 synthase/23S rRNA pseudouridine746 synthase